MTKSEVVALGAEVNSAYWAVTDFLLECPPLLFRLIAPEDDLAVSALYTSARIQQFIAPVLSGTKALRRFAALQEANSRQCSDKFYLTIADKASNEALGMFAVFNIDVAALSCEFGIMLTEQAQGRGIARHALIAILSHMQHQLGTTKIYCVIHQQNLPAQRLARQCQMRLIDSASDNFRYVLDEPIRPWCMP